MILTFAQRGAVARAKNAALQALSTKKACQALFCDLIGEDGIQVIEDTDYRNGEGARNYKGEVPCDGSPAAWTYVGARFVLICDSFVTSFSESDRMLRLLHEALHTAGLKEAPDYPNAPTEEEINKMVRDACS